MASHIVVGIASLVCVSTCGMISTFANWEMMDKVNEKLPREEQFAALGWYLSKNLRLHREYKRLYPDGRLLLKVRVVTAIMFACAPISLWAFGFLAK